MVKRESLRLLDELDDGDGNRATAAQPNESSEMIIGWVQHRDTTTVVDLIAGTRSGSRAKRRGPCRWWRKYGGSHRLVKKGRGWRWDEVDDDEDG